LTINLPAARPAAPATAIRNSHAKPLKSGNISFFLQPLAVLQRAGWAWAHQRVFSYPTILRRTQAVYSVPGSILFGRHTVGKKNTEAAAPKLRIAELRAIVMS
jgi:hypothetical protein